MSCNLPAHMLVIRTNICGSDQTSWIPINPSKSRHFVKKKKNFMHLK